MPRGTIDIGGRVEFLSILDENGDLDESLEPDIPDDTLKRMHRTMLRARRFDERMLKLQRQGRIGTFAPVKGQEAAQVGTIAAIGEDDWFVPAFRETAAMLWRGTPLDGILLFNAGYNEGGRIPDEQNDLPIAIPVATQLLHAVGLGYGMRYFDDDNVAMTYFGDGATSEGDFHEALNFASVFDTPVVFVCQNNQWAISVPRWHQTKSKTLAQKALAYGLPGIQVDGNDLLAVHAAASEAVARARKEGVATMIECVTYRIEVHTTADDPSRYRDEEEVERWKERDPIERFQGYLKTKKLLDDDAIEAMEEEIEDEISDAWKATEEKIEELADDPLHMFEHLYAETPPHIEAQREELRAELEARADGGKDGKGKTAKKANKEKKAKKGKKGEGNGDG